MKKELQIFLTAVMFYSRIPCPSWVDHSEEYLNKATRYFPLIGWIVGVVAFGILVLIIPVLGVEIAVILSIAASVFTTGAFHEDGFADMCDGFGGGWTTEQVLTIMKDSRLGTYGAIGLFLMLLLKFFLTLQVVTQVGSDWVILGLILISAHSLSRFTAASVMLSLPYVQDIDKSKVKPIAKVLPIKEIALAGFWGILPFVVLIVLQSNWMLLFVFIALLIARVYLVRIFKRKLGGYTGDCLGAAQQVTEAVVLSTIIALWNFM